VTLQEAHPARTLGQSTKLQNVVYEIRGPANAHAARLEAEGHRILKLNIGNPAPFGFEAPGAILRDVIAALPTAQGYSDSRGSSRPAAPSRPVARAFGERGPTLSSLPPTVGGMAIDWTRELVDQLDWHWNGHFRPRLDGLTDEEYLWEPVPGCWSVRTRGEATSPMAVGAGDAVIDYAWPEPEPAPVTTIAWRMGHIAIGVFGERAANHFGAGGVAYESTDWPLTAEGGLALLDRWHDAWSTGVAALDADGLARPCGPHEGPFADHPFAALILHINREALHHAAEISLMRDLYAHRPDRETAPTGHEP
jgi:hypothetical protein